jgi:hypothetical protein
MYATAREVVLRREGNTSITIYEDNMGRHGLNQTWIARDVDLLLTTHGQQGVTVLTLPTCAASIELFGPGQFSSMSYTRTLTRTLIHTNTHKCTHTHAHTHTHTHTHT